MTTEQIYQLFLQFPVIVTDSRKIVHNSIFIALKGENFDGNEFAGEALTKGAAYTIVDDNRYYSSQKTILVENTLKTLQELARLHRQKLGIPVLGITGTNGKTTTKELIAAVLSKKYRVVYTPGNLNNHIGVPLTLLSMSDKTEFGVVEMGANHPGEIAELCAISDPDFGIITNIGKAHLEGFGSFEGVKKTKAELYNYLNNKNGIVFFNKDNSILKELTNNLVNKVSFGLNNADLTGEPVNSPPPFVHVKANFPKGVLYLNTRLTGKYNVENIMAAACIGNYFNVDPIEIQEALKKYEPSNNRSQLFRKGDLQIIMDAYNANPTSMQASIESFISGFEGDKYLILGDMLELGRYSEQEHKNLLEQIQKHQVNETFLIGPVFTNAAKQFSQKTFLNATKFCEFLKANPIKKGAVLIKGSRGIALEKILEFL